MRFLASTSALKVQKWGFRVQGLDSKIEPSSLRVKGKIQRVKNKPLPDSRVRPTEARGGRAGGHPVFPSSHPVFPCRQAGREGGGEAARRQGGREGGGRAGLQPIRQSSRL